MGGRGLNLGWRFDYMIVDKESIGIVEDSSIHKEYYGSDHCPIRLIIDLKKGKEFKETSLTQTHLQIDMSEVQQLLQTESEDEEKWIKEFTLKQ